MNITIDTSSLLNACRIAARAADGRSTLPILSHIHLRAIPDGTVSLTGSNMEITISAECQATQADQPGETTVNARKLQDILAALPKEKDSQVRLQIKDGRCQITCGRGNYRIGMLPADDFPLPAAPEAPYHIGLPASQLVGLLATVAHAQAKQDVRHYLNGTLLEITDESLIAVATDGHRLARAQTKYTANLPFGSQQVIIPERATDAIIKLIGNRGDEHITIAIGQGNMRLTASRTTISTTLVQGTYPDYRRVIPNDLSHCAAIDRRAMLSAISRVEALSNDVGGIRVTYSGPVLRLDAVNAEQEQGTDEIDIIDYTGPGTSGGMTIGYSIKYLNDALTAVAGDLCTLSFADAERSTIIRAKDDDKSGCIFVIMPMRL